MYLTEGLRRSAEAAPDATATVFGDRRRTFAELADRVARPAGALRGLGAGIGDRAAMLALNSDRYHEYLLATLWAGATVNPVNIRWSAAEVAYSPRDSRTTARPGRQITVETIREHTKSLIAGYKAPRSTEFVAAMPVSGTGKILKRDLRAKYWNNLQRQVH